MKKYRFVIAISIIFILTVATFSLLSNKSDIVKSQTNFPYKTGNTQNQPNNSSESSDTSNSSASVQPDTTSPTPTPAPTPTPTPTATPTPISTPPPPVFNITTLNYQCTTGDSSIAIQNAIDSLPQNRTEPMTITMQGAFNSVHDIILEDNINFVGQNAVIYAVNNSRTFILDPNKTTFSEAHKVFNIDGYPQQFVDWINLHNVTFQSIDFEHPLDPASGDYAIDCFQGNTTGWGVNDNINIYNCTFNGFYSGFYGLPINSNFINNVFQNYSSNGFMLAYGLNVTVQKNTFETPSTDPIILSYPGSYPIIGLHLLDINVSCLISDNTFITGNYSTGLAVVSSSGNITVTNNIFMGNGQPIAVDFYPRPFSTEGLFVYDNFGQPDFSI